MPERTDRDVPGEGLRERKKRLTRKLLSDTATRMFVARGFVQRVSFGAPVVRWLPVVSSACVTALGILLCASAWSPGR